MQDLDITSSREPVVQRLEIANSVILTFYGLRNANVRDRDTHVRLTLPAPTAVQSWRQLSERLTEAEKASG
jgi:hypothetical protein